MKKRVTAFIVALVMVGCIFSQSYAEPTKGPLGIDLSDMSATTLEGDVVYDGSLFAEHQFTVLNLWASWCGPCRQEMPALNDIYHDYADREVTVLGLFIIDTSGSTVESGLSVCNALGIDYPSVIINNDATLIKLANNSGNSIPVTYLVDRDGIVRDYHVGSMTYNGFANFINRWIDTEPESISVYPKTSTLPLEGTRQLFYNLAPEGALQLIPKWESSNESIITVNETGVITGVGLGTAVVTVSMSNGISDSFTITVEEGAAPLELIDAPYFRQAHLNSYEPLNPESNYMLIAFNGESYYMLTNESDGDGFMKAVPIEHSALGIDEEENVCVKADAVEDAEMWRFESDIKSVDTRDPFSYFVQNFATEQYLSCNIDETLLFMTDKENALVWDDKAEYGLHCGSVTGLYISLFYDFDSDSFKFGLMPGDSEGFIGVMLYELVDETILLGDANCDGSVNTGDASAILQSTIGAYTLSEQGVKNADFNEDGVVNTGDASGILKSIIK